MDPFGPNGQEHFHAPPAGNNSGLGRQSGHFASGAPQGFHFQSAQASNIAMPPYQHIPERPMSFINPHQRLIHNYQNNQGLYPGNTHPAYQMPQNGSPGVPVPSGPNQTGSSQAGFNGTGSSNGQPSGQGYGMIINNSMAPQRRLSQSGSAGCVQGTSGNVFNGGPAPQFMPPGPTSNHPDPNRMTGAGNTPPQYQPRLVTQYNLPPARALSNSKRRPDAPTSQQLKKSKSSSNPQMPSDPQASSAPQAPTASQLPAQQPLQPFPPVESATNSPAVPERPQSPILTWDDEPDRLPEAELVKIRNTTTDWVVEPGRSTPPPQARAS